MLLITKMLQNPTNLFKKTISGIQLHDIFSILFSEYISYESFITLYTLLNLDIEDSPIIKT